MVNKGAKPKNVIRFKKYSTLAVLAEEGILQFFFKFVLKNIFWFKMIKLYHFVFEGTFYLCVVLDGVTERRFKADSKVKIKWLEQTDNSLCYKDGNKDTITCSSIITEVCCLSTSSPQLWKTNFF